MYSVLKETLAGRPQFVPAKTKLPITKDVDHYVSIFYYTADQKKQAEEAGTIKVIKSTITDRLYIDFDDKDNLENARQDCLDLASKLVNEFHIPEMAIDVCFTGNKGFSLEVQLDKKISNEQFKAAVTNLAGQFKTFDPSVTDHQRVVSVPNTRHRSSGLYKIPLTLDELDCTPMEEIKALAKTPRPSYTPPREVIRLPEEIFITKKEERAPMALEMDWDLKRILEDKPRHIKDYKWALLQGFFEAGERNNALMVIAATCRGLGYDRDLTIKMCESAIEKQAERTKTEPFDLTELVDNIIDRSVFSKNWEGGTYTPQTNPWLKTYCERLGIKIEPDKRALSGIDDVFNFFQGYAKNIDDLTIKTGIASVDRNLRMTVGMSVGILAPPGAGKTSVALQILNNMSNAGHRSLFFSYDMFQALVYQKLVQKHFGASDEEIFESFKTADEESIKEIRRKINEEYKNVDFCFEAGQTCDDIINTIKMSEEKSGHKIKLIVVDYSELVITDKSDPTAASSSVAQKLREIANVHQLCVVSLYQPNKAAGGPSDEMLSYHSAKGSGTISQSVSVMLGMSRPGFHPRHPEDDKFLTINCLKNRMGKMFSLDLHWNGLEGTVRDLTEEEREHLRSVRQRRVEEENESKAEWG